MMGVLVHLTVRGDACAPGVVREAISQAPDLGGVLEDVMLVASELVTNAVRHSRCTDDHFLTICVSRNGWLRISVFDPGPSGRGTAIANLPMELGGMGLKVVMELASRWGTERRADGYKVWADLELAA
jgi:anti-sigma regulatory factor (Ser/Thr protein kinase)